MPKQETDDQFDQKTLWKFTAYTAALIDSGTPLITVLDLMKTTFAPQKKFAEAIAAARENISNGKTFASALKEYPQYFDEFYTSMVNAGEMGGILDTVMNRLADLITKRERWKKQMTSRQFNIVMFLNIFGALMASGVSMLNTLDILCKIIKDPKMAVKIGLIKNSLSIEMMSFHLACIRHDFCLTPEIMMFLGVGESNSALDLAASIAGDLYLKEIELGYFEEIEIKPGPND
jgi:type II secretory pathway component PulF